MAIDGSKFKAVNNRDRNFTRAKVERRRAQIEESVARYLQQLDTADRHEPSEALAARCVPSRLCNDAAMDQILVSNAVRKECGRTQEFCECGDRRLKGFRFPVRTFDYRWRRDIAGV